MRQIIHDDSISDFKRLDENGTTMRSEMYPYACVDLFENYVIVLECKRIFEKSCGTCVSPDSTAQPESQQVLVWRHELRHEDQLADRTAEGLSTYYRTRHAKGNTFHDSRSGRPKTNQQSVQNRSLDKLEAAAVAG